MTQKVYNANERIAKWYDWYCRPGFSRQIQSNHYCERVEETSITPGTNESEGFLRSPAVPHISNSMSTPLSNRILPHLNPYKMYSMDTTDDVCMKVCIPSRWENLKISWGDIWFVLVLLTCNRSPLPSSLNKTVNFIHYQAQRYVEIKLIELRTKAKCFTCNQDQLDSIKLLKNRVEVLILRPQEIGLMIKSDFVYNVAMSIVINYATWNSICNLSNDISSRATEANIQNCRTTTRKDLTAGRNRTSQLSSWFPDKEEWLCQI